MSLHRRAAKRDANESDIIRALEAHGCQVMQLNKFDLLVYVPRARRLEMLEVKSTGGRMEKSQRDMLDTGWPLKVVYTPEEALTACGV